MRSAITTQIVRLSERNISWNDFYRDNAHLIHGVPHRPGSDYDAVKSTMESAPVQDSPQSPTSTTQDPSASAKDEIWKVIKKWAIPALLASGGAIGGGGAAYQYLRSQNKVDTSEETNDSTGSLLQSLEDKGYHVGGRE